MGKKRVLYPEDVQKLGLINKLTRSGGAGVLEDDYVPTTFLSDDSEDVFDRPTNVPNVYKSLLTDEESAQYLSNPIEESRLNMGNVEDFRAENQSAIGNMLYRAPVRVIAKIPQEVLKGAGIIGGGLTWLLSGADTKDMGIVYDNAFNRGVDDAFNSLYNSETLGLKVHVPRKVQEGSLWDNMSSSTFWATEGADAAGFFAAMLVPGAILSKAGIGAKVASGFGKLGKLNKALNWADKLATVQFAGQVDNALAVGINTIVEAGEEASGVYQNVKNGLVERGEDINIANAVASEQASKNFVFNTLLLVGPNALTQKFLMGKFNPKISPSNVLSQVEGQGIKLTGANVFKSPVFRKDLGAKLLSGIASEGFFEEGSQTASENFFTKQGLNKNVEPDNNEENGFLDNIKAVGNEFANDLSGIAQTYMDMLPDTQMQKSIFLGGLLGGVTGSVGAYRNYQAAQSKIYGYDGPTTKIGSLISKTPLNKFFTSTPQKGIKQLIDEGTLTNFSTLADIIEVDAEGKPVKADNGEFIYNPEATAKLGKDVIKKIATDRIIQDAQGKRDKQSVDYFLNKGQFDMFKPFLGNEEGVTYLKDHFIPNKSDELIRTREKYANRLSADETLEMSNEKINEQKNELIKKVDEFKKIFDRVNDRHSIEMNIKYDSKDKNTYDMFDNEIRNLKMESRLDLDFTNSRINSLETSKNEILSNASTINKKSPRGLKKGDFIKYKGEAWQFLGNKEYANVSNPDKIIKIDYAKEAGKQIPLDIEKYVLDKGQQKELVSSINDIEMNKEFANKANAVLDAIHDDNMLQSAFNERVKSVEQYRKQQKFKETFKPESFWKNNKTGERFKIREIGDDIGLYKEEKSSNGGFKYTKQSDLDLYKNQEEFLRDYKQTGNTKEEPIFNAENIAKETQDEFKNENIVSKEQQKEETTKVNKDKSQTQKDIEDVLNRSDEQNKDENLFDALDNPEITNDNLQFSNEPEYKEEIPNDYIPDNEYIPEEIPLKPVGKVRPLDEPKGMAEEFPKSEGPDTNPELTDEINTFSFKRHIFDLFRGTANNPRIGTTDDYKGNPKAIKADLVASNFNLAQEGYKLKIYNSFNFPEEASYFRKEVEPLGYKWEDTLYAVLTKDNKLISYENNELVNANDLKDAVAWTLRLPTTTSPLSGEMYYTPDVKTQMDKYEALFPNQLIDFKGTEEQKEELAIELFNKKLVEDTEEYKQILDNIQEAMNKGDVYLNIIGKSLGIPNVIDIPQNAASAIKDIEGLTNEQFKEDIDLIVATKSSISLDGISTPINTKPGRIYAYSSVSGQVYPLQPRKLGNKDAGYVVDLLNYYVNRINSQYQKNNKDRRLVNLHEASRLKDKNGNNITLDNNDIGIFDILSKLVRFGDDRNINSTFKFTPKSGIFGGTIQLATDTATGTVLETYPLIKDIGGVWMLNNELIEALMKTLPNRYIQVESIKVANNEDFLQIKEFDFVNGNVIADKVKYRDYMFNDVLLTNVAKPQDTQIVNIDDALGGGQMQFNPTTFSSVYLKLDLTPFSNKIEEYQEVENTLFDTIDIDSVRGFGPSDIETILNNIKAENEKGLNENIDDDDLFTRQTFGKVNYTKENISFARDWFTQRFPQFGENGFTVVNNLIQKGIFGMVHNNAVYLDQNAEVGTVYHEAFHVVSQMLLSSKDRNALYNEWRTKNNSKLSDKQVEEELAEDYRDYRISGGKFKYPNSPIKQSLFRRIFRWIKEFFLGPDIQTVFDRIDSGYYKNVPLRSFTGTLNRNRTFESDDLIYRSQNFANQVMEGMSTYFFDEIRKSEGSFDTFFNKDDNQELIDRTYNKVKENFNKIYMDAGSLYNTLSNKTELTDKEKSAKIRAAKTFQDFNFIMKQFEGDKFIELKDKHARILKEYGLDSHMSNGKQVDQTKEYDEEVIKDQNDNIETIKDSGWELADRSIKFSAKQNASKSIKLLVGTLAELRYDSNTNSLKEVKNDLGLPKPMKFGKMFNSLLTELSRSKTVPEIVNKLNEFKKDIPAINYFFTADGLDLNKISNGDVSIPINKFNEILQLTQTFSKTENFFSSDLLLPNGKRILIDSNEYTQRIKVKKLWESNANKSKLKGSTIYTEKGNYKTSAFSKVVITEEPKTYLGFLKSLGIEFTNFDKIKELGLQNKIKDRAEFILADIRKNINTKPDISSIDVETNEGQALRELIDIEYNSNIDLNELSSIGMDGDTRYNHSLNSYISNIIDNINKFKTWNDMVEVYPHLNTETIPYLRNSLLLRKGGLLFKEDGNRKKISNNELKLITVDGSIENESGNTKEFSKLGKPDKMSSIINRAKNGQYNMIRPADKKLERFLEVNLDSIDTKNYTKVFSDYLSDELTRTLLEVKKDINYSWKNYNNNKFKGIMIEMIEKGSNSRNFLKSFKKFIFSENIDPEIGTAINSVNKFIQQHQDFIDDAIENYFKNYTNDLFKWSVKNKLIDKIAEAGDGTRLYESNGLNISETKNEFEVQEIGDYLLDFTIKDTLMNIEQTKMIFGDPIYFKKVADFFKRTGSFPGTKKLMISDYYTDNYIANNLKRVDGAENLRDQITGAKSYSQDKSKSAAKSIVRQVVIDDIPFLDDVFGEHNEEADGYSITSFDEYREMLFRTGDWSFGENSLEDLYQWEMQTYYGPKMDEDKFVNLFGHKWNGIVIDPHTKRVIDHKPSKVINMLKPLYVGPYAELGSANGLTKTSFGILFPSLASKYPNLQKTMDFMVDNQVGVVSFYSANKGITTKLSKEGKLNKLYDSDGEFNLNNLDFSDNGNAVLQNTFYEFWGIQLDTGNKVKDKVITGTQMMKQIIGGLFKNGKIDDNFNHLNNTVQEYISLNNERLNTGKDQMLTELDIREDEQGKWYIKDYNKFKKKLLTIAEQRDMADNILDSIELIDENLGVDMLLNRAQFEPAIFGLNDSLVIKQKRKGTAMYQMPSTLFENSGTRIMFDKKRVKASNDLKMYEAEYDDDGNVTKVGAMEVYLPNRYKDLKNVDGKLLQAIGFRIPTQGLGSIEAITIKGFLPIEAGDTIVLPSSIVSKAGSDYDIDKLNIYLPNYYATSKGSAIYINYVDNLESSYKSYNRNRDQVEKKLSFNEFKKLAIENRITELQREILLDPANYKNLTKSLDDSGKIIKKLVNQIFKINTGVSREGDGSLLDITNRIALVDVADRFLSSKEAVGITALASPFHIMAQMADLYIEDSFIDQDGTKIPTIINLPHNKRTGGGISIAGNKDANGNDISDALSQWISEAVDAAKDPRMFDLNVNLETLNVVLYLTMAGVPQDAILYFMNQPIILDYISRKEIGSSQILAINTKEVTIRSAKGEIKKTTTKSIWDNQIITSLKSKYGGQASKFEEDSTSSLLAALENKQRSNKDQVRYLEDYLRYKAVADKITKAIQGSSYDTNSAGKSIPELLMKLNNTNKVFQDITINDENDSEVPVLGNYKRMLENEKSFLYGYYNNNKSLTKQFSPLFKVSLGDANLRALINFVIKRFDTQRLSNESKTRILNLLVSDYFTYNMTGKSYDPNIEPTPKRVEEMMKSIEEGNPQNILSKQVDKLFTGQSVAKTLDIYQSILKEFDNVYRFRQATPESLRIKYKDGFKSFANFYKKYRNNELMSNLIPIISDDNTKSYDHIVLHNRKLDQNEIAQLTDDWVTILNDSSEKIRNFGMDLFKMLLLQDGIKASPINFLKLAPAKLYADFVKSTMNNRLMDSIESQKDATKFFLEWHIANSNNSDIVPNSRRGNDPTIFPFLKDKKNVKEAYQKLSNEELASLRSKGVQVDMDNYSIRQTHPKDQKNKNDILDVYDGISYKMYRQYRALHPYNRIKSGVHETNLIINEFMEARDIVYKEQNNTAERTLADTNTTVKGNIPYIEYLNIKGDNKITEQEWNNLTDSQRENAKNCK